MCLNSDDTVFIKILNLIICWEGKAVLFVLITCMYFCYLRHTLVITTHLLRYKYE